MPLEPIPKVVRCREWWHGTLKLPPQSLLDRSERRPVASFRAAGSRRQEERLPCKYERREIVNALFYFTKSVLLHQKRLHLPKLSIQSLSREADVLLRPSLLAADGEAFLRFTMPRRFGGFTQTIQTDGGSEFEGLLV